MGKILHGGLMDLSEKHSSVGDVRGIGLFHVIELVKNRRTREPMSSFNQPLSEPMQVVAKSLRDQGLSTFVRWNWIFCTPPLVISESQIQEGLDIIDHALTEVDRWSE